MSLRQTEVIISSTSTQAKNAQTALPTATPFGAPGASDLPSDRTHVFAALPSGSGAPEQPALTTGPSDPSGAGDDSLPGDSAPSDSAPGDAPGWNHPHLTTVLAGAGAAATSTLVGGHLGAAGTVIGAALASIITTLALNVYDNTLRRAGHRLRRVVKRDKNGVPLVPLPKPTQPLRINRRMIGWTALTALAAAVLGLGFMIGLEHSSATPITPGTSQLAGTSSQQSRTGDGSGTGQDRTQVPATQDTTNGTSGLGEPSTAPSPAPSVAVSVPATGPTAGPVPTPTTGTTGGTSTGSGTTSGTSTGSGTTSGTSTTTGTTSTTTGSGTITGTTAPTKP